MQILLLGCASLKEKRSRVKPLLARLHREFNISVAEVDSLDDWDQSWLACALVSNDAAYTQRALQNVIRWVEHNWPDVSLADTHIELF